MQILSLKWFCDSVLLEPGLPNYSGTMRIPWRNGGGGASGYLSAYEAQGAYYNTLTSQPVIDSIKRDANYNDVTIKSIAIARYLKIFWYTYQYLYSLM